MSGLTDGKRRVRIAMYCHNRDGLGHIARCVHIAGHALATGLFDPILLTGCRALNAIAIPSGVEVHPLTPIPADPFSSDHFRVLHERIRQIQVFVDVHSPDILLVDTLPFGYKKELKGVLDAVNRNASGPLCVLGLPYPVEELKNVVKSGNDRATLAAYKCGMIYSNEDTDAYDHIPFPLIRTGIVCGPPPPPPDPSSRVILVLAGGGVVSRSLLDPLVQATERFRQQGLLVRFVIGPLADLAEMTMLLNGAPNFELLAAAAVEEVIGDAKLVVARCGYNTAAALMRTSLPVIFIPWGKNEMDEQFVRAKSLSTLKNIRMINPNSRHTIPELETAIGELLHCETGERSTGDSFSGGENAAKFLTQIAAQLWHTLP